MRRRRGGRGGGGAGRRPRARAPRPLPPPPPPRRAPRPCRQPASRARRAAPPAGPTAAAAPGAGGAHARHSARVTRREEGISPPAARGVPPPTSLREEGGSLSDVRAGGREIPGGRARAAGSVPGSNRREGQRAPPPVPAARGAGRGAAAGGRGGRWLPPPRPTRPGSSRPAAAAARRSSAQQVGWPVPLRDPCRSRAPPPAPGGPPRSLDSPPPASSPHPPDSAPSGATAGEGLSQRSPERPGGRRGLGGGVGGRWLNCGDALRHPAPLSPEWVGARRVEVRRREEEERGPAGRDAGGRDPYVRGPSVALVLFSGPRAMAWQGIGA